MAKNKDEDYRAFNSMLKPSTLKLLKLHAIGTSKKIYEALDDLIQSTLKPK